MGILYFLCNMIIYSSCPSCGSEAIKAVLMAKDHTVSGEQFEIWECSACTLRFTQAAPGLNSIASYYKSEDYISHSDTKEGIINTLYHTVRKMTLNKKKSLVKTTTGLNEGSILDVGCGTGAFLHTMQQAGWEVTGLEPDLLAREKARELYRLQPGLPEQLFHLPLGSYHAITLWHVLEHVHQLHEYLDQLKKLLRPGGKIFIAVPNYTSYDAEKYGNDWAAYDVPRHLYHFSPGSMARLLSIHGLNLAKVKPMWYDSFYVSMLSEKYKSGHNNILSACWNGYVSNFKAFFDNEKTSSIIYIAG